MPSLTASLVGTLIFNTLIAAFLTAIGVGGTFGVNLVFSQCIGLSIASLLLGALRIPLARPLRALVALVAILAGAFVGGALARLLTGVVQTYGTSPAQSLLLGLVFGGIAAGYFWLRERNAGLEAELQAREMARLEAEKQGLVAQMRLLQAQIEPHFLFNSLANVSALIEADPKLAGTLLDALIRYLRASLARTRAEQGSLGDEVALLTSYLDVLKIRMGARLDYEFDIDSRLLGLDFPPMLLQPLVENAVRHGIEPKVTGGRIEVTGRATRSGLELAVVDNGVGFCESAGGGLGLTNVRERLAALFGPEASLAVVAGEGGGVRVTLAIPMPETA